MGKLSGIASASQGRQVPFRPGHTARNGFRQRQWQVFGRAVLSGDHRPMGSFCGPVHHLAYNSVRILLTSFSKTPVSTSRRCCTNPHWPARCQPTGFSPADAIRHWSAEGGHPIEDFAAEDYTHSPCPAGFRARRPSPMMDLYRKNAFSTRP